MKKLFAPLMAVVLSLGVSSSALAQVAAFDASTAVTYLETNAGTGMAAIGLVVLTLAALGVTIKWVKATFFG